jgi:hypothetical protein
LRIAGRRERECRELGESSNPEDGEEPEGEAKHLVLDVHIP